jgi:hypothetical protein
MLLLRGAAPCEDNTDGSSRGTRQFLSCQGKIKCPNPSKGEMSYLSRAAESWMLVLNGPQGGHAQGRYATGDFGVVCE